ncbi:AraC family transcriptional regulator [Mesorhizobium sp. LNJC405B00]|uniref:helix-turn-helix domain-containing protein n=1 Tax=Mesorhizobium sp. LNJC405B00 TaxID=1287281 RepID=UPI0018DB8566|nr:AraC family transcriptional regulator [Mesorhizobium sp. LNJC405B00]
MTLKVLHRQSTQTPEVGRPGLEQILREPGESFVWRMDDYPCALGQWNYHPEFEIHLVRKSVGRVFVGDHIGHFEPGYLGVVGSNLPHNWVTDIKPGEVIQGRDIIVQFDADMLRSAVAVFPEMAEVEDFLSAAARGLHYYGTTATKAAAIIEAMGGLLGLKRLVLFFDLVGLLTTSAERDTLSSEHFSPDLLSRNSAMVHNVVEYILQNLHETVSMTEAAGIVGMTAPTFCKFFKKNTGHNFRDYVRLLRVGHCCRLLAETELPVTEICYKVGYGNLSNFNRHFLMEKGVTPTQYRRLLKERSGGGFEQSMSRTMGQFASSANSRDAQGQ